MAIGWILLCFALWGLQESVTGMCDCRINFETNLPRVSNCPFEAGWYNMCKLPGPPSDQPVEKVTIKCIKNKLQCFVERDQGFSHCCRKHITHSGLCSEDVPEPTCELIGRLGEETDLESTTDDGDIDGRIIVGSVLGSLIVLILLAIVALQLLRIVHKRKQEHMQQGVVMGEHAVENLTYVHSVPQKPHLPSVPEYAVLSPPPVHALPEDSRYHLRQHIYEDADKYYKYPECSTEYSTLMADEKETESLCFQSPPISGGDDYAVPEDTLYPGGSENQTILKPNQIKAVKEHTSTSTPEMNGSTQLQTVTPVEPDPHTYAVLIDGIHPEGQPMELTATPADDDNDNTT